MKELTINLFPKQYEQLKNQAEAEEVPLKQHARQLLTGVLADIKCEVFQVTGNVEEARNNPSRIIAEYNRQEYVGPDNERWQHIETQYWDVTAKIESMDIDQARDLMDNDHSTDPIVHHHSDHEGPHSVYVTKQIQKYWKHVYGEPLWE